MENNIVVDWSKNEDGYEVRNPFQGGLTLKERFHAIIDPDPAVVADKVDAAAELNNLRKKALRLAATAKVLPGALAEAGEKTFKTIHPAFDTQPHKQTREDVLNAIIFDPQSATAALDLVPGMGVTATAAAEGASLAIKKAVGFKRGMDLGSGLDDAVKLGDETADDIIRAAETEFDMVAHNAKAAANKTKGVVKEAFRRVRNPTRIEKLQDVTAKASTRLSKSGDLGKAVVQNAWRARHPLKARQSMIVRRLSENGEQMMMDGLEVIHGSEKLKKQLMAALTPAQRMASESYGEAFNALRTTKPKALGRILGKEWYAKHMNIERALGQADQWADNVVNTAKQTHRQVERFGPGVARRIGLRREQGEEQ